jgi:glycerol-3-phosphate dehydrogenase
LDANAATEAAPVVAALLAAEMGKDEVWQKEQVASFKLLAQAYLLRA